MEFFSRVSWRKGVLDRPHLCPVYLKHNGSFQSIRKGVLSKIVGTQVNESDLYKAVEVRQIRETRTRMCMIRRARTRQPTVISSPFPGIK